MARKPARAKAPGYFAPVSEAKYIVLIPWYHRRRGWITQQYKLEPPATVT